MAGTFVVTAALAVAGVAAVTVTARPHPAATTAGSPPPQQVVAPTPTTPSLPPLAATPRPVTPSVTSRPVHLDVPAIGVSTDLEGLGVLADGTLASPSAWQVAGWFDAGVRPGDVGPAVIAGHVDSTAGPAVFYRLRDLAVGDTATVTRADGSVATFAVDTVARFPKAAFPTQAVYGRVAQPVLRLITCTGDFDRARRSYVDNLVVSMHLTGTTRSP
ncbi:class F sortase [Jatrophihabitans sp. YIM 134969]